MEDPKKYFLTRKKTAISELMAKANAIADQLASDPDFLKAMQERKEYLDRKELWVTPRAMKFAPIIMQIADIRSRIAMISGAIWRDEC